MTALVRVLVVAAAALSSASACDSPFVSVGTGCYYFSEELKLSWDDARIFCQDLSPGADLAVVDDCHQFQLVWGHIVANYDVSWHWIGATDQHLEGTFYWVDGTPVVMGTPFWASGQPNGENQANCVNMASPYGYYCDLACSVPGQFVCQQLSWQP